MADLVGKDKEKGGELMEVVGGDVERQRLNWPFSTDYLTCTLSLPVYQSPFSEDP